MALLAEYALTPGVFDVTAYSSEEVCGLHLQTLKDVLLHEGCVFRASRSPIPVEADQRFRHVDHVGAKRRWVWSTWLTSGDRSRTTWSS